MGLILAVVVTILGCYGVYLLIKLQEGVQSFTLGNMSESYAAGAGRGLLSQEAKELLKPWLLGGVMII